MAKVLLLIKINDEYSKIDFDDKLVYRLNIR